MQNESLCCILKSLSFVCPLSYAILKEEDELLLGTFNTQSFKVLARQKILMSELRSLGFGIIRPVDHNLSKDFENSNKFWNNQLGVKVFLTECVEIAIFDRLSWID
ncbi:hypothetical protein DSO57_1018326 [Entomophthora muscae]|uniref:Uncharacterized protein n=1 Tax=Entomophthora muscae TaxID=34485 RepID=A0ACC2S6A5_9FUNG|nr:hypothetical protein DSO57_1018326 [Entomophthora muscae]